MTRSLTQAQLSRRLAILDRLEGLSASGDELCKYLVRKKRIIVTVDTVQVDLRALEKAGRVKRWRSGHYWVWEKVPERRDYEKGNEEARRQSRPDDVT